jgi:hypothetical protein
MGGRQPACAQHGARCSCLTRSHMHHQPRTKPGVATSTLRSQQRMWRRAHQAAGSAAGRAAGRTRCRAHLLQAPATSGRVQQGGVATQQLRQQLQSHQQAHCARHLARLRGAGAGAGGRPARHATPVSAPQMPARPSGWHTAGAAAAEQQGQQQRSSRGTGHATFGAKCA